MTYSGACYRMLVWNGILYVASPSAVNATLTAFDYTTGAKLSYTVTGLTFVGIALSHDKTKLLVVNGTTVMQLNSDLTSAGPRIALSVSSRDIWYDPENSRYVVRGEQQGFLFLSLSFGEIGQSSSSINGQLIAQPEGGFLEFGQSAVYFLTPSFSRNGTLWKSQPASFAAVYMCRANCNGVCVTNPSTKRSECVSQTNQYPKCCPYKVCDLQIFFLEF